MPQLTTLAEPDGALFTLPAHRLTEKLAGPTLVRIPGDDSRTPVFITTLLHGNETSGWTGLCRFLADPPAAHRPLIVFIGNPEAAARHARHLPDQPDYNRIWKNTDAAHKALTNAVLAQATQQPLFAAIDLHNNTGRNPHYSVVTSRADIHLRLAYLFSHRAVLVEEPDTVLSRALQHHCPSIAAEVGPINDTQSDELAFDLIMRIACADTLDADHRELLLYRALARVHINPNVAFAFADTAVPLSLTDGMEAVNFHDVPEHTEFAYSHLPLNDVLTILDPDNNNVTQEFFYQQGAHICLRKPVVPAMYTTDPEVIRQDCLCYLMRKV